MPGARNHIRVGNVSPGEHNRIAALLRRGDDPFDRAIWYLTILMLASLIFSTALVQTSAVLLIVVWVAKVAVRGRAAYRRTVLDVPLLAFIVARILAIPLSVDPAVSAQALRTEIVFYPLYFVFTSSLDTTRVREIRFLLRLVIATAVIASIIGMTKYFAGISLRACSTTAGYYTLGLYLCVALPLALVAWEDLLNRAWIRWAVGVLIMLGIVFTFDRIHWAGMILVVVIAGVMWERKLLALLVLVGVVAVVLFPPVANRLSEAVNFTEHASGRDVLWRGAYMLAGVHPVFGFGLRTFPLIFPLKNELTDLGTGSWHNDYVQVYMESGLVGLIAMIWFIVVLLRSAVRAFRRKALLPTEGRTCAALLIAAVVLFVVGGFLDTHVSLLFRFFFALLGLYLSPGLSGIHMKTA